DIAIIFATVKHVLLRVVKKKFMARSERQSTTHAAAPPASVTAD
ncbi:MAG: hypothetical protein QOF28_278, partial [Actinomycetota bacterium]|nr:hypothetical protein [Actinomycetota bacterium]